MAVLDVVIELFRSDSFLFIMIVFVIIFAGLLSGPLYYFRVGHFRLTPEECVVVVTGTDSGFGQGVAIRLAERGYLVVALCFTKKGATELKKYPGHISVIQGDVTKESDVDNLVKLTLKVLKQNKNAALWAVINNAGCAPMGHVAWLPTETFRQVMEVNYFGCLSIIKKFMPFLKMSRNSRIINVSSMAGISGGPAFGAYSASKHALQGLTTCLREELKPWGVHVTNVNPCFMKTPMITNSIQQARELFESADLDVRMQYREEVVLADGAKVLWIAESPIKVVNHICDLLLSSRAPHFLNYVGVQAGILRFLLVLPKALIEMVTGALAPSFVNAGRGAAGN